MQGKRWFILAWILLFFGLGIWLYINFHRKVALAFAPVAGKKIYLYGDESMESIIFSLKNKMEFEVHPIMVENATTYDLLEKAKELVFPQNPRAILIVVGKHDIANNIPSDTSTYNFAQIVKSMQERGVFVTYLNWKAEQSGWNLALFKKQNEDMGVLHIECSTLDCTEELERDLLPQFY